MTPKWDAAPMDLVRAGRVPDPTSEPAHRTQRLRLVLGAVAAMGVWSLSGGPAEAGPGKVSHRGQGHVATAAPKHARPSRPAVSLSKRPRPDRPVHARARSTPDRTAARRATMVHTAVVPLVNTAWDDPVMPPDVLRAIRDAARDMNVDPALLMALAWRESRFDPQAKNGQSSATGLLQFTSETWLRTVREFGAEHGAEAYAAAIHREQSGELTVQGPQLRTAILDLRNDPALSAKLAAATLARQRAALRASLGREVVPADLYLRHVLGPSGAMRFLAAVARRPSASSLDVASRTTLRNAGLLARDGRPMTVAAAYAAVRAMLDALHARSEPLLAAL